MNPEKAREMRRNAESVRRARQRDAFVAPVRAAEVFALDNYRCYLCGKKCLAKAPRNHPDQATLDHVVPLSVGGTHEPSNVRTACRKCNCAKSNRGGGEQFALNLAT